MRAEKRNPQQVYNDFWDWLVTNGNNIWVLSLLLGYIYYLKTTVEV